jgi:sialidase-1
VLSRSPSTGKPAEGGIEPWLGEAKFEIQPMFSDERFPNVVVATDGTVLATWGSKSYRVRRSEDGGETWGAEITVAEPGFHGGGVIVDEKTGDVLVFVEAGHPPAPLTVYRSKDHGKTWQAEPVGDPSGRKGQRAFDAHERTRHYAAPRAPGRPTCLRPTRSYAGGNGREFWPEHYTNAIYSDDGGKTWKTSDPFPAMGRPAKRRWPNSPQGGSTTIRAGICRPTG